MKEYVIRIELWAGNTKRPSINAAAIHLECRITAADRKEAIDEVKQLIDGRLPLDVRLIDLGMMNMRVK